MTRKTILALAGLLAPVPLAAQLADPSTRALGLANAYSTQARGYEAPFWNPAMLAAPRRPGFSIGLPHVLIETGSNTYNFSDFRRYSEEYLTDEDKQYLLDQIALDDSVLSIRTVAGISPIGISIGPFAFTAGTSTDMDFGLGRDAVELALFGNARRSGPGESFSFRGTRGGGWAATTLAGSFAQGFRTGLGHLAVGVTYKKVYGHFLGRGTETSSQFAVNPNFLARAQAHAIYTDYDPNFEVTGIGDLLGGEGSPGSGYGVDVGAVLTFGDRRLTLSAVVTNVAGSMEWDPERFRYDRVRYAVSQGSGGQVFDTLITTSFTTSAAINADPAARALRDSVLAHANFSSVLRVGAAFRYGMISFTSEGSLRLREGLDRQPERFLSAGGEIRLLNFIPLRAGIGTDFDATLMLSAGTGIHLLGLNVDFSVASLSGSARPGFVLGLGAGLIW
ncbi:MAG TPA: DUF5723 family protein [Gemmatimonadales bacterium]|nr:DUF5723 family protein [Gemmatimonadales bacterium]